jgi:hypothetical protein
MCRVDLDGDSITEIGKAWPHLEELDLGTRYGWRPHKGISLDALVSLIDLCPDLHTLGIVIDGTRS